MPRAPRDKEGESIVNPSGGPDKGVRVRRPERYAPARGETRGEARGETTATVIPMLVKPADDLVPMTEAEAERADQSDGGATSSYGGAVEAEIIDLDDWRRFTLPPDLDL